MNDTNGWSAALFNWPETSLAVSRILISLNNFIFDMKFGSCYCHIPEILVSGMSKKIGVSSPSKKAQAIPSEIRYRTKTEKPVHNNRLRKIPLETSWKVCLWHALIIYFKLLFILFHCLLKKIGVFLLFVCFLNYFKTSRRKTSSYHTWDT